MLTRSHQNIYEVRDNEWRSPRIFEENIWGKAVHRAVADGGRADEAEE
jgi:hypothetical protein